MISYIPVLLVGLGVNYVFAKFGWSQSSTISQHLVFPVIVIFIVSTINIWNVDKRRPAMLKEDEFILLPSQALLNTMLLIFCLFLLIIALQFIGVKIEGGYYDFNKSKDVWFNLLFTGTFSIITLLKKLNKLRNN